MALPDFLTTDLLPAGIHSATEADINDRCVIPFPASKTRSLVFDGLCRYRAALNAVGVQGNQWIDGSFVDQSRLDPEDVDLVNVIPYSNFATLRDEDRQTAEDLLGGEEDTKPAFFCHTFLLLTDLPMGHPQVDICADLFRYWQDWFSKAQDYSDPSVKKPAPQRGKKGIVRMAL